METSGISKKNKHLTQDERREIEDGLRQGMTFKAIAAGIRKDSTTVSYEVKKHRAKSVSGFTKTEDACPLLLKPPYVCNGCLKRSNAGCKYIRYLYRANNAHSEYKALLHDAREGTPLNKEQFYIEDAIITSRIRKGQHINHILASVPEIQSSRSTVYRNFHKGYYSASVCDLPRMVKFKPRRMKHPEYVPSGMKIGRTYDDFLSFMERQHMDSHVETDTVIGREGGKVIMTIHFTSCNFMCGLLLDNKSSAEASEKFTAWKDKIRNAGYSISELMPVILTDNGGEFSNAFSFENNGNIKELSLFYCDPMKASQKPQIEKNHTLFRSIVPKGSSFDAFTQETVNLIFSHVNAVKRSMYRGKSAYELFSFLYPAGLAEIIGIKQIPAEDVCQSPALLKNRTDLDRK